MAPTAHVLVYFVTENGTVVADSIDIHVEGTLQNFVSLFNVNFIKSAQIKNFKIFSISRLMSNSNQK